MTSKYHEGSLTRAMFDSPKKTNELEMKSNNKRPPPLSSPASTSPTLTPTKTDDVDDEMNKKEIQMNSNDNNMFVSTKSNGEKVDDLEAKANAILAKESDAAREARRKRRKVASDIDGFCGGVGVCCADCCAQSGECCVIL